MCVNLYSPLDLYKHHFAIPLVSSPFYFYLLIHRVLSLLTYWYYLSSSLFFYSSVFSFSLHTNCICLFPTPPHRYCLVSVICTAQRTISKTNKKIRIFIKKRQTNWSQFLFSVPFCHLFSVVSRLACFLVFLLQIWATWADTRTSFKYVSLPIIFFSSSSPCFSRPCSVFVWWMYDVKCSFLSSIGRWFSVSTCILCDERKNRRSEINEWMKRSGGESDRVSLYKSHERMIRILDPFDFLPLLSMDRRN